MKGLRDKVVRLLVNKMGKTREQFPLPLLLSKFADGAKQVTTSGKTLSRIAKIRSRSLSNSALSQGERKSILFPLLGEGKMFAKQTETNLPSYRPNVLSTFNKLDCFTPSHKTILNRFVRQSVRNDEICHPELVSGSHTSSKRSFASLKMTSVGHSEQQSHKLDCFARPANCGNGARNDVTTLVPQYLSALVPYKKAAFTLAEVLIILGIIGVVAAITIPNLVQNYKKSEASARLKKFNSMMSQAVLMSEQDNGPAENWSTGDETNFDLENYFTTYLAPYLQYTKTKSLTAIRRYYIYLADGTYFYLVKGNCVDVVYFVNGKKNPIEGKDIFHFLLCGSGQGKVWCDGRHFCPYYNTGMSTREQRLKTCKNSKSYCSGLLEMDNWEFKDDYPFRL